MRPSQLVASVGFLLALPVAVGVALLGYDSGLYPYAAAPFVVAGAVACLVTSLFVLLPRIRRFESRSDR